MESSVGGSNGKSGRFVDGGGWYGKSLNTEGSWKEIKCDRRQWLCKPFRNGERIGYFEVRGGSGVGWEGSKP